MRTVEDENCLGTVRNEDEINGEGWRLMQTFVPVKTSSWKGQHAYESVMLG